MWKLGNWLLNVLFGPGRSADDSDMENKKNKKMTTTTTTQASSTVAERWRREETGGEIAPPVRDEEKVPVVVVVPLTGSKEFILDSESETEPLHQGKELDWEEPERGRDAEDGGGDEDKKTRHNDSESVAASSRMNAPDDEIWKVWYKNFVYLAPYAHMQSFVFRSIETRSFGSIREPHV